jgi:hypothetical protein
MKPTEITEATILEDVRALQGLTGYVPKTEGAWRKVDAEVNATMDRLAAAQHQAPEVFVRAIATIDEGTRNLILRTLNPLEQL